MSTVNPSSSRTPKKGNSETVLLAVLGAIILIGGGMFFFLSKLNDPTNGQKPPIQPTTMERFTSVLKNARHERGVTDAPITIVEFADAECPHCRRAYNDVIKTFETRNDIRFVFFHKPFPDMHPTAMPAALAMEAAGRQNKFWPMYDALFLGKKTILSDRYIETSAQKIGLDMTRFRKDWKDKELVRLVEQDVALSESQNIESTPTFIVHRNGTEKVTQCTGGAELKEILDNPDKAEIKAAQVPKAAGL